MTSAFTYYKSDPPPSQKVSDFGLPPTIELLGRFAYLEERFTSMKNTIRKAISHWTTNLLFWVAAQLTVCLRFVFTVWRHNNSAEYEYIKTRNFSLCESNQLRTADKVGEHFVFSSIVPLDKQSDLITLCV